MISIPFGERYFWVSSKILSVDDKIMTLNQVMEAMGESTYTILGFTSPREIYQIYKGTNLHPSNVVAKVYPVR